MEGDKENKTEWKDDYKTLKMFQSIQESIKGGTYWFPNHQDESILNESWC